MNRPTYVPCPQECHKLTPEQRDRFLASYAPDMQITDMEHDAMTAGFVRQPVYLFRNSLSL